MNEESCVKELLNGLDMGIVSIDHLTDKIESDKFREIVKYQRKNYAELKERVEQTFSHIQDSRKKNFMLETMIEMKTLLTNDSKIAKMLIEGSNQAVMTMTHLLNKENHIDSHIKNYANDFEDISKRYIEELKEFL